VSGSANDERDEVERVLPGWKALVASVAEELTTWRRAHPHASLSQIEDVVEDVGQRLRARASGCGRGHWSRSSRRVRQPIWRRSLKRSDQAVQHAAGGWNRADASDAPSGQLANARPCKWIAVTRSARRAEPVFSPLDEELELLPGELSATLLEGVARLGTHMPFEQAATELAYFWGVELEETTVRRHTQAAGAAYVAEQTAALERLERERWPVPAGPAVQYLSADGAMVPLVGGEWAEVKTLAIGEVEVRRAADDLPEAHTTDLSYISRLADAETFTRQAYVEAYQRGTESAGIVCAVQDGAEWEQGLVDVLRPNAVRILDFPHAVEHLTAAAQPSLGIGTPVFTDLAGSAGAHAQACRRWRQTGTRRLGAPAGPCRSRSDPGGGGSALSRRVPAVTATTSSATSSAALCCDISAALASSSRRHTSTALGTTWDCAP
jgi:hypothetical protein